MRLAAHSILLPTISILLAACVPSRQYVPFAETDGKEGAARIYVIRTSVMGSAIPFAIYSNADKIGTLGPKSHLCWLVKEGTYALAIAGETKKAYSLAAKAGETYYFKAIPQMGIFIARAKLELITANEAQVALAKTQKPVLEQAPTRL